MFLNLREVQIENIFTVRQNNACICLDFQITARWDDTWLDWSMAILWSMLLKL